MCCTSPTLSHSDTRLGITTVYHLTPGLLDFCSLPGSDGFWSLQSLEHLVLTHSQTAEVHSVQSRGRGMRREWFHGQIRNCESPFPSQSLLCCLRQEGGKKQTWRLNTVLLTPQGKDAVYGEQSPVPGCLCKMCLLLMVNTGWTCQVRRRKHLLCWSFPFSSAYFFLAKKSQRIKCNRLGFPIWQPSIWKLEPTSHESCNKLTIT